MFEVIFYEDERGYSELYEELQKLRQRAFKTKDARIQFKQITLCIELLKLNGTHLPENIAKHIQGELYELRPVANRILFFHFHELTFVLLHMFAKKSKKTPRREIEKAKREIKDLRARKRGKQS